MSCQANFLQALIAIKCHFKLQVLYEIEAGEPLLMLYLSITQIKGTVCLG
jgi:hypothetical protein